MATSRNTFPLLVALCGLVLTAGALARADVIFVDADASGADNGTTWDDAFNDLQDALAAANTDDEVWVAQGNYAPAGPNGDRSATFQLISAVGLYGGFAGDEADRDQRDWETNETILTGDLNGDDEPGNAQYDENSYHVVTGSGTDTTAVIDGFTITAGNANVYGGHLAGGGMLNDFAFPTVANCTFRTNRSDQHGGGMSNTDSDPTLVNCAFFDNVAGTSLGLIPSGGGLYNERSSPLIVNCVFAGNRTVYDNFDESDGGGIGNTGGSSPMLLGCVFSGNSTDNYGVGGGLFSESGCLPILINCTLFANWAGYSGDAVYGPAIMTNCIAWTDQWAYEPLSGVTEVSYSNILGGYEGEGNIDVDPQYVDGYGPDGTAGTEDDDLRLSAGSPCIDAANSAAVPPDSFDLDGDGDMLEPTPWDAGGNPRFVDDMATTDSGLGTAPVIDMGAYEFYDCNGNGIQDDQDIAGGTSEDCSLNMVPDECEADCNSNGVADSCDTVGGTSLDCNANEIPDECIELEEDCNANAVPDSCDIADGTSQDMNGNGIPDDCEADCNANGIPDDLDIASGTSRDCNANTIPDDCEPDCNEDGTLDQCDLVVIERIITTVADGASSVFAADLDGDGDIDVLSASQYGSTIEWYENPDGLGNFGQPKIITTAASGARSVFAADLDGDGDFDALSASFDDGKIAWYENTDGLGSFGPQQNITTAALGARSVFAADLDGDGDIDVLSAVDYSGGGAIAWYENTDGLGSFGPLQIITTEASWARSVFAADLDGDGDIDALSASFYDNKIAWYENTDGLGSFGPQQVITTAANGARSVFATDLDGDGDIDVLSASENDDEIAWYENTDGLGSFGPQQIISTAPNGPVSVFAADLDGDGDRDVLSASNNYSDDTIAWYENTDGLGSFGPQQIITADAAFAMAVFAADLDGDGDMDVLSASRDDDTIAWYSTPGGSDCNENAIPDSCDIDEGASQDCNGNDTPDDCEPDCNGNDIADECDISSGTSLDCAGNGIPDECEPDCNDNGLPDSCDIASGTSEDCNQNAVPDECDLAGGSTEDCNRNEIPDECEPDCNGNEIADECDISTETSEDCNTNLIPDECEAVFIEQIISVQAFGVASVVAADLDGDGDADVLSASRDDDKIAWYENTDGLGSFGLQQTITLEASSARSVFAADLDGDGDSDVLSASDGDDEIAWYENIDGLGNFGPERVITSAAVNPWHVFAADLDGDGDFDVLSASYGDDQIAWYENTDGLGSFGPKRIISMQADSARSAVAADLDGDGDNDVLSASNEDDKIAWYENTDGLGSFGPEQVITTAANGAAFAFAADLDGDGDNDVISASEYDDKIAWYENTDGLGSFGPQQVITTLANGARSVFAADLDGDGDADILSASWNDDQVAWYENTDGLGSFGPQQIIDADANGAFSVFAADLDGDGDPDILSASINGDKISWYANPDFIRDCNTNGVPDSCDIAAGTSQDIDENGVPDECEVLGAHNLTQGTDYATIQQAINSASTGDEIEVDPGTYAENIDFLAKDITVRSTDPLDSDIVEATIIDGGGLSTVVTLSAGEISGFTIRGGGQTGDKAGGVHATGTAVVSHNLITGNSADTNGGGVIARDTATVHNNRIVANSAAELGGGVSARNHTLIINNYIAFNAAEFGGGGLRTRGNPTVRNNTIVFNSSADAGPDTLGGGGVLASDTPIIANNVIAFSTDGVGYHSAVTDNPIADYNCVFGNFDGNYSDDAVPGSNDLNVDPELDEDEIHLGASSPCIDAGDPDLVAQTDETDIDNQERILNGRVDIGCDEFAVCEGDANGDGTVDPLDSGYVLARFGCPIGTGDPDCDLADMNGDGAVDPLDVGFILARFGTCD